MRVFFKLINLICHLLISVVASLFAVVLIFLVCMLFDSLGYQFEDAREVIGFLGIVLGFYVLIIPVFFCFFYQVIWFLYGEENI